MTLRGQPALFWAGCAAIVAGAILHVPMLAMGYGMGGGAVGIRLVGMPMDGWMTAGMALIALGLPLALVGAMPRRIVHADDLGNTVYEAADDAPLTSRHALVVGVLLLGLIIDTMKPATLGFVLPGVRDEYGIDADTAALLPFVALTGTTVGSLLWGWLADICGRRTSILLSTVLFVATSLCGAMPDFSWNLVMCFAMGASAGGMLPVVYALLAEIMPPRHRSWVLVLIGGVGSVGGYLAASGAAWLLEPLFGWRSLWLLGMPTGLLLLALARWIPESPRFLLAQGRKAELDRLVRDFRFIARTIAPDAADAVAVTKPRRRLGGALVLTALGWSVVTFGLLLWLPSDLRARGFDPAVASAMLASSALIALPTVVAAALLYSRWSSKGTVVLLVLLMLAGLGGALLPASTLSSAAALTAVIALLVVGSNGLIAVLLPYTAENYPLGIRGRATGLVAGSSKFGGMAVQGLALFGLVPTLAGAAPLLIVPVAVSALLVSAWGRESRGRSLRDLEGQAIRS
ncbi:MFS transporter [Croceicoccus ponticola]|uniref:MFS transporter n=1 Tax=Croceicoccus ponticola TaxID=2217664 RepID=A0A437GXB5_9SPHN|nr:MFS transporter [Croceicoccus ponticola]RVQ67009.1 MFS transporter [Croceicoccus ponticola]